MMRRKRQNHQNPMCADISRFPLYASAFLGAAALDPLVRSPCVTQSISGAV
jgi:hypothetical protein